MSVTDVNCTPSESIDIRNAMSVRRIYNLRGEPVLEFRLANADASVCVRCGQDIGQGTVHRPPGDGYRMSRKVEVFAACCDECVSDYRKREAEEGRFYVKQPCGTCDRVVVVKRRWGRLHVFCSPRCQWAYYNSRVQAQGAAAREKTCTQCGASFTATRRDAKTCSAACKQKAYRQRKKGGEA